MAIIGQTTNTDGNLVIYEEGSCVGWTRKGVTVNETVDTVYGNGLVLGKVTATGKYKVCSPAAGDGSQNAAAILRWDSSGFAREFTVKATIDTKVVVSVEGPMILSKDALRFGAGFTTQPQKDTAIAQLETLGMKTTVTA